MGSTESQGDKPRLEREYRLIRRFLSDFYAGGEITVIEHKQTREQLALKELVQQLNPQHLIDRLEKRKGLAHRNLIQLRTFWVETDLSICSSLNKVNAIFEYHENSVEDWLGERGEGVPDADILDFLRQMLSVLAFLERNRIYYLLAGPRSIVVAWEEETALRERERKENQIGGNRFSSTKLLGNSFEGHRCSLVDLGRNYAGRAYVRTSYSQLPNTEEESGKRRVYKIFQPLQGLSSTRSVQTIQSYLQVPIHPQLSSAAQDNFLLSDSLIRLQNLFTVVFVGLAMCEGCDVFDLDIFNGGRLSLEKLRNTVNSYAGSHPRMVKEMLRIMAVRVDEGRQSQGLKIKDVSLIMRDKKTPMKENWEFEGRDKGDSFEEQSFRRKISRKRISLLHN